MKALRSSLEAYDKGNEYESPRMANEIAKLVYDSQRTRSILSHIGDKDEIEFVHSGEDIDYANLFFEGSLIRLGNSSNPGFRALSQLLTDEQIIPTLRSSKFEDWWSRHVIKTEGTVLEHGQPGFEQNAFCLTRKSLIMTMRDQDSGAHFDDDISDKGYQKTATQGTGVIMIEDGVEHPLTASALHATVRQIAWELITSLLTHYPQIPSDF
jgi:hypothetical protein